MSPSPSRFHEVVHASREEVWAELVHRYGDIHVHNPTMQSSRYLEGAVRGELGVGRHCRFSDRLWLEEEITVVDELERVTVVATEHNLPFLREMSATYELSDGGEGRTEITMTSYASTWPSFMIHLMRGQLGRSLEKHLFGMRHYIETGETVDLASYDAVHRRHRR